MSKLLTKTILPEDEGNNASCLLENKFYIKDYQRGYRWESKQVQDLLNDINNFDDENHKLKYCLQPLIVKPIEEIESSRSLSKILNINYNNEIINENSQNWELIDGQQRLTTIWLILNCCNSTYSNPDYSIYYETERNVDKYYLGEAKKTIENWFSSFGIDENNKKADIKQKIEKCVQFIWYEVPNETDSEDIFRKINNGKIALTNAELFKAQLLNTNSITFNEIIDKEKYEEVKNYIGQIALDFGKINNEKIAVTNAESLKAQLFNTNSITYDEVIDKEKYEEVKKYIEQIAFEWDKIEQSLNDDDFWYFISNEKKGTRSQIDFLLELRAKQLKKENLIDENILERDNLFSFLAINSYLSKNDGKDFFKKQKELWEEIVQIHDTLKTWYNDNELYHYIGFLIATAENGKYIEDLTSEIKGLKKSEIKETILKDVKKVFEKVNLDELDYTRDRKKIKNVLLFFNVFTMIQSKTESKFSFKQYKTNSWDIEHIHARATEQEVRKLKNKEKMISLLEDLKNQFLQIGYDAQIEEIDKFIAENLKNKKDKEIDGKAFFDFFIKQTDVCGNFDENNLGNLTLLDYQTNRSYHNALFPIKRKIIIERDKGEVFIPVCTKNVFLKMYSKNVANYMKWSNEDSEDYFNAIKETLEEEAKLWK